MGSGGVPWGSSGVPCGPGGVHVVTLGSRRGLVGIYADPELFPVHTHMHRKALEILASGLIWIRWDPVGSHVGPRGPLTLSGADPSA